MAASAVAGVAVASEPQAVSRRISKQSNPQYGAARQTCSPKDPIRRELPRFDDVRDVVGPGWYMP